MEKNDPEDKPPSPKKQIKTIYISNILEGYYKSYNAIKSLKERLFWTQYDIFDSNRALLYGDDHKIIITASPIYKPHFNHMVSLMQWKEVQNIFPSKSSYSISNDCAKDHSLKEELLKIIKENPGVKIIPYRSTPQFQALIHFLKAKKLKFETPETIPEEKQFILNYFSTKRGFRHLWHISHADNPPSVQIPEGFITQNKKEAIDAAWWFKEDNESFVIKYNSGVQGIGIELINYKSLPHDRKKFDTYMKNLLKDTMWNEPIIIIERAIPTNEKAESVSPSIEMYIDSDGKVLKSYVCDQILAADKRTFRGIYIYPELMKDAIIKKTFRSGIKFGKQLAQYGYRGVFDMDLMRSSNNKMYVVEANLRRTGGTHLHELCLHLLGKKYGVTYHTLIEDIILKKNHQLTYEKCMAVFQNDIYTKQKKSGILIANPDMLRVNILALVIIGTSKEQIQKLRTQVDTVLKEIATETSEGRDW